MVTSKVLVAAIIASLGAIWAVDAYGDVRCRERGTDRSRLCGAPFKLSAGYVATAPGTLPSTTAPSGLVAICSPNTAGTAWQCVDANNSAFGSVSQGTGADYQYTPFGAFAASDITTPKASSVTSATLDALWKSDHTLVMAWYATTASSAAFQHVFGFDATTNAFYTRNDSGNYNCTWGGSGGVQIASVGSVQPLNGWTISACKRSGNNHFARVAGTTSAAATGSTITSNNTANTPYYFGDRQPAGGGLSLRGGLAWVAIYNTALSDSTLLSIEKAFWGLPNNVSGSLAAKTYCNDYDGGSIDCFFNGSSIVTTNGFRTLRGNVVDNKFAADNLAATGGTDVGTPTITAGVTAGPFFNLNRTNECARMVDDDPAAFEGKQGANGYVSDGFYTASFYLQAGDTGTTKTAARIKIDVTGGAWPDAGVSQICDITGLTSTTTRATCTTPKFIGTVSPTVKASILVGNAVSDTGSIMVCERQFNATSFATASAIDNASRGNTDYSIDPSGWPSVSRGGKYEVVFVPNTNTNTDWAGGGQTDTIYLFDAYDNTPDHSVVMIFGYNTAGRSLARTQNGANITEFLNDGVTLVPGTPYAVSMEWRPSGSGCSVKYRFNSCTSITSCTAGTIVSSTNSGFCPSQPTGVKLGNRYDSSVPSDVNIYSVKVYSL